MASATVMASYIVVYLVFHAFCAGIVKAIQEKDDDREKHTNACRKRGCGTGDWHPELMCDCMFWRWAAPLVGPIVLLLMLFGSAPFRAGQWLARRG